MCGLPSPLSVSGEQPVCNLQMPPNADSQTHHTLHLLGQRAWIIELLTKTHAVRTQYDQQCEYVSHVHLIHAAIQAI